MANVWSKELADGSFAVLLLNLGPTKTAIATSLETVGLPTGATVSVTGETREFCYWVSAWPAVSTLDVLPSPPLREAHDTLVHRLMDHGFFGEPYDIIRSGAGKSRS